MDSFNLVDRILIRWIVAVILGNQDYFKKDKKTGIPKMGGKGI